jgi:CRP/FNR family transcriptional regulator
MKLEREAREALERLIRRRRTLRRGEYLFRSGDPYRAVSVLCSGSAKTCAVNHDSSVQVLSFHFPGELIGLCGLGAQEHLCDAVALETVDVCEIPLGRLMEVAEQSPAVRRLVYRFLGEALQHQHQIMQSLIGKMAASGRLAAYLLSLVHRHENRGLPARELRLSMSRHDIGNYLGLAKETVSRLFSRFERDGLISVRARQLRVNDLPGLATLAGQPRTHS